MLMITHYHERCWPAQFEFDWSEKLRTISITKLMEDVPSLRKEVEEYALEKYQEVFKDQLLDCIKGLKYFHNLN